MKLKELVDSVIQKSQAQKERSDQVPPLLVRIESAITCYHLLELLNELSTSTAPDIEATEANLKPLIEFLDNRWRAIQLTDANYCHSPYSLATQLCLAVAEILATITNKTPHDFLFSTVPSDRFRNAEGGMLKLHECIFADDRQSAPAKFFSTSNSGRNLSVSDLKIRAVGEPIDVYRCFEAATKDFYRKMRRTSTHDDPRELNDAEFKRLQAHSSYASSLIISIIGGDKAASNKLLSELKQHLNAGDFHVGASYGMGGQALLLSIIMSDVKTFPQLSKLLSRWIDKSDWDEFLSLLNHDELKKLIASSGVSNPNLYTQSKELNAAVLYCFAFSYKSERVKKPEYAPIARGWLPSGWMREYNREEKIAATDVLLSYLSSHLNWTIDAFIEQYELPPGVVLERVKGALDDGELGKIVQVVRARISSEMTPEMTPPAQTRYWANHQR